jgi:hypothetical protein
MSGSNDNNNNNKNNDGFIRKFAAEIAQALREQDATPRQASVEESLATLYRSLCFDEPMIDDVPNLSITASALCRQLQSSPSSPSKYKHKYALSNRFVNGIVYLCQRQKTASASAANENNTSSSSSSNANTDPSTTPSASVAMAKLAFCVLIQVPLECCCQQFDETNLPKVQQYLGSYKGNGSQEEPETTQLGEATVEQISAISEQNDTDQHHQQQQQVDHRVEQLTKGLSGGAQITSAQKGGNEPEEVWATASDPSDYDYGEGSPAMPQVAHHQQHQQEKNWLDPLVLSKADPQLAPVQARAAIESLLQQANYTLLAPIFTLSKKEVETYISQLTQLLLVLLTQPPQNASSLMGTMESSSLQDAILSPLWVLRDAALHSYPQQQQFYTSSYLEVLQTLLAVDQAHLQDIAAQSSSSKKNEHPLCSASIVGLSALSSWCSTAKISTPLTISAVVDSMNDLCHVVERAAATGYKDNLTHSVIPILELLTGITYNERRPLAPNSTIPQALLNSGLLRQLLVLALEAQEERASVSAQAQCHFHHALWGLCVAYPKIVGKYVARYPGIPTVVRQYDVRPDSSSRSCVHSILWNCYGWSQCEDSQAPRVVWKTTSSSSSSTKLSPPLARDECKEVCAKSWTRLCQIVETALRNSPKEPKEALAVLHDWERLLSLVGVPSVATVFVALVEESSPLQDIAGVLSELAQQQPDEPSKTTPPEKDEYVSEDESDKKKPPVSNWQLVVSKTRKLLKQYTLLFQGNVAGSSKTD